MALEIFPFILLRTTALPLDYLEALNWPNPNQWQAILTQEAKRYRQLSTLLNDLSPIIGNHPDYKAKNTLANLYKDLVKQRNITPAKYQSHFDYSKSAQLWFRGFNSYVTGANKIESAKADWLILYEKELPVIRMQFQKILQTPELLNGLPLSSASIHYRLNSYLQKNVSIHRKKEWQTERTALKFLSRVATKTSPFSSYTTLSIQSLNDVEWKYNPQKSIRLNNYILAYFQQGLAQIPGFYRQMPMKVNPSLRQENGFWKYIFNSKNIESLQEIEAQPLLDLLLGKMTVKPILFYEIVEEAQQFIEADAAAIEAFLLQLLALGLVDWDWQISGNEKDWLEKLQQLVAKANAFSFKAEVIALLQYLQNQTRQMPSAEPDQRVKILQDSERKLKSFFHWFLGEDRGDKSKKLEQEDAVFKRIAKRSFDFKAEKLFYEDQSSDVIIEWSQKGIEQILSKLDHLIDKINPLVLPELSVAIWEHFEAFYPNANQVDVLNFYDSFYRNRKESVFHDPKKTKEIEMVLNHLEEECKQQADGIINISLTKMESILSTVSPGKINLPKGKGQAALFHFYKNDQGILQAYLESNFMGYGKMMGRFLHLFPEEVSNDLREWNRQMQDDELWLENIDASYFNANLHPRLLDLEITSPGSQNTLEPSQQIAVIDLEITKDKQERTLFLRHKKTHQKVAVFNFGFEALESRSSMFQLLQSFAYQNPSLDILIQLMEQIALQKLTDQVLFIPRLVIDQCLVLKRKRWYFPLTTLPILETGKGSDATFFLAIQRWRECWQLPKQFFLSLQPRYIPGEEEEENKTIFRKTDDYKPQFICLDNPLLVQLLGRLLRKVTGRILIEEMLPETNTGLEKEGRGVEVLLEWRSSKN